MIKQIFKICLQYYLKYLAKLVLIIQRPIVIGIAGSVNKAFFKDEIAEKIQNNGLTVGMTNNNFNTEIGLPLSILNLPSGYNSYKNWLSIVWRAPMKLWQKNFPRVLALEFGVSNPGDMAFLCSIAKPKIVVITEITKRYLESFSDIDNLMGEFRFLVRAVGKNGLVVLNSDNSKVAELAKDAKAEVAFFGRDEKSFWRIEKIEEMGSERILALWRNGKKIEFIQTKYGEHHILALIAALIVDEYVKKQKN